MAPPGQLPRVRSAEASIEKGRAAYADQRFRVALEHFTLVAGNCPCSRPSSVPAASASPAGGESPGGGAGGGPEPGGGGGGEGGGGAGLGPQPQHQQRRRRERCTCRDFGQAAARHRRERGAVYAEATRECRCGAEKTWGRCHREGHVQALDYRAACFEKMGKLDMARRDAEWLLEIAPQRLEGYMRLGKIYRLEKKPELAWAAWSAGVEVGQKEGLVGTPKYEQLWKIREPLHKHFCRRDPMDLPVELIEKIFSYFEFYELCRMSGVCKRWEHFFDTHPYVWRALHFRNLNAQKPPRVSFLKNLKHRTAGRARSLIVPNAHAFQLNSSRWITLIQTTNPHTTTRLEIGGVRQNMEGDWGFKLPPPKPPFFEGLTELKLGFHRPHQVRSGPQPFVRQFVQRAAANLQSVSLASMYLHDLDWPELPRLKVLQLTGATATNANSLTPERTIDPVVLARATPNLEQLSLDNFGVFTGVDSPAPPEDAWSLWPSLAVIRLGTARSGLSHGNKRHFPPLHPSSFRVFEARAAHQGTHGDWLPQQLPLDYSGYPSSSSGDDASLHLVTYPNLSRFWMPKLPLPVDLATILLEPAVRSGRLREVGLCWHQDPGRNFFPTALDFLRGCPSVRTLGFFQFDFESHEALTRDPAHRGQGHDPAELLFRFVESFPALETLELHSDMCDPIRIGAVVERVVELGRVKRVYQRAITGAPMDRLRAFCEAHGAELLYGGWEPPFPVPLEPLEPVEVVMGV